MADQTELRMNLAAIKRVDPYAKDIVDSSAHVAFYTFNSDETEWEKTDVEGAFFIYSRNAEPFYSIFINNRLNTNSLVEPIAGQLELQSQPPFLLYRNERSRIRGFWFYNKTECDRIGGLVEHLVKDCTTTKNNQLNSIITTATTTTSSSATLSDTFSVSNVLKHQKQQQQPSIADIMTSRQVAVVAAATTTTTLNNKSGVDIFTMLTKAQEDFNNAQVSVVVGGGGGGGGGLNNNVSVQQQKQHQSHNTPKLDKQQSLLVGLIPQPDVTSQSVMNFFAAAKPTAATAKEVPLFHRMLSKPVHVDQIEKQQRTITPHEKNSPPQQSILQQPPHNNNNNNNIHIGNGGINNENGLGFMRIHSPNHSAHELGTSPLATFINTANLSGLPRTCNNGGGGVGSVTTDVSELELRQQPLQQLLKKSELNNTPGKLVALMPPTMFTSGVPLTVAATVATAAGLQHIGNIGGSIVSHLNQRNVAKEGPPPGLSLQPLNLNIGGTDNQSKCSVIDTVSLGQIFPNQWQSQLNQPEKNNIIKQPLYKPEPLTQSQLLQAMGYLIKNDPDFIRKLHEAYLKSFTEMVSL